MSNEREGAVSREIVEKGLDQFEDRRRGGELVNQECARISDYDLPVVDFYPSEAEANMSIARSMAIKRLRALREQNGVSFWQRIGTLSATDQRLALSLMFGLQASD